MRRASGANDVNDTPLGTSEWNSNRTVTTPGSHFTGSMASSFKSSSTSTDNAPDVGGLCVVEEVDGVCGAGAASSPMSDESGQDENGAVNGSTINSVRSTATPRVSGDASGAIRGREVTLQWALQAICHAALLEL